MPIDALLLMFGAGFLVCGIGILVVKHHNHNRREV